MLNEFKILFDNIKNFRHLLNESVGDDDIIKYIQNHEYVYMYYDGDDNVKKGYRTIRPYVLGVNKSGHKVIRAWQDNPKNSHDFDNRPTRKDSYMHDYWTDDEGMKPGWRMFRLDKISKIYPTGKKFNDSNGLVMIPSGYHEGGDDDMSSIIAYVSTKKQPDFDYKYDKNFYGNKLSRTDINTQKWDSIRNGNKNSKKITPNDIINLRKVASNVYKKGYGNYLVAIDNRGNFQLITPKDKDKNNIPNNAIVGSLPYLYDTIVKTDTHTNNKWFNDKSNELKKQVKNVSNEIKEVNLPSIPFERKTFFKS